MHIVALVLLLSAQSPGSTPVPIVKGVQGLLNLLDVRQRPTLVHFWATWCGACVDELPEVAQLSKEAVALGVDVAFVSLDPPEDAEKVMPLLRSKGVPDSSHVFSVVLDAEDPGPVAEKFDPAWTGGLPATFLRLQSGAIAARHLGTTPVDKVLKELRSNLKKVEERGERK